VLVQAQYSGPNDGLRLRDQTENAAAGPRQSYPSEENGSKRPELVVTWA